MTETATHDSSWRLEQQARYRLLAGSVREMVSRHDAHGVYLEASPASERLFGYHPEELIGLNAYEFIHPEDYPLVKDAHSKLLSDDSIARFEYRLRSKNGGMVWVETSSRPLLDPLEGSVFEIICVTRDISEQKETLSALHESQQHFAAIFNSILCGVMIVDLEGRMLDANAQWLKMTGYSAEGIRQISQSDLVHPNDWKRRMHLMRQMARGDLPSFRIEQRFIRKDGSVFWGDLAVTPLHDAQGKPSAFVEMAIDISERKRSELQLQWESSLNASLARLSKALISQDESLTQVSQLVLDEAKSLTGSDFGFVAEIDPESKSLISYTLSEMMAGGQCDISGPERRVEFPIGEDGSYPMLWGHALNTRRPFYTNNSHSHPASGGLPEGHVRFQSFLAAPVMFHNKLYGLVALANRQRLFTPKDLEAALRLAELFALAIDRRRRTLEHDRLNEQIQQARKLESLGILAGGVAHDFNNLLMVILSNAELSLSDLAPDSPQFESLKLIQEAALRGAGLTKQMLSFAGGDSLSQQTIDLNQLLKDLKPILRSSIGADIDLSISFSSEAPSVLGDSGRLRQGLMNLVVNASEAIEGEGRIELSTGNIDLTSGTYTESFLPPETNRTVGAYIEVKDSGCGIEPDALPKLFDPFYTTKFTGRGLGLAALVGIVKAHRGAIDVISAPGAGSTFRLLFPPAFNGGE